MRFSHSDILVLLVGWIFGTWLAMVSPLNCRQEVVRDAQVYWNEIDFMNQASLQTTSSLLGFIKTNCKCESDGKALKFTTTECGVAADRVLVVQSRIPWHKAMMLYNAGLLQERPPKNPPTIPEIYTLCP